MKHAGRMIAGTVIGVLTLMPAGCNVAGPAFLAVHGPPSIPAAYTLPAERATIVFVDDRGNYLPRRTLREIIASNCGKLLLEQGEVKKLIEPKAALSASLGEKPGEPTDLVTLTKNCQAEVMIYATVDNFSLSTDGGATFEPTATLRVKVIDALAPQPRLWPQEREGKTLKFTLPVPAGATPQSAGEIAQAEEKLAAEAGRALAELFYDHPERRPLWDK